MDSSKIYNATLTVLIINYLTLLQSSGYANGSLRCSPANSSLLQKYFKTHKISCYKTVNLLKSNLFLY